MSIRKVSQSFEENPRLPTLGIYIGFVKQNEDAQRMGRLAVYIPELGGEPDDSGAWVMVQYASPFAGATDPVKIQPNSQTYDGSQQSYGLWMIPPDLNNEVAVFFANNDITRGYWFACCFQTNMNHMVPGIATSVTTEPPDPNLHTGPVVEYNKANVTSTTSPRRPRFQPLSDGLAQEGLTSDNERGSASTSARREAPSQVFGLLTPRGNSLHIDDNTSNEFIRMRTRSGTQVLVHETSGYVYINSKSGNSWIEISDAGIDMYTSRSISLRTESDFNIRADGNINMDAQANFNIRAGKNVTIQSGGDIQNQATGNLNLTASRNVELYSTGSILNVAAVDFQISAAQDMMVAVTGPLSINATGDLQVYGGANIRLQAADDLTQDAGGNLRMHSGADMTQLSGGKQIRDGSTILDDTKAAPLAGDATPIAPGSLTPPVLPIGLILSDAKLDIAAPNSTVAPPNSNTPLWKGSASQVNTIVPRMPTHEPWHDHPNANVPPPPTEYIDIQAEGTYDSGSSGNTMPDGTINDAGCSTGVAGTKKISSEVYNAIMNACTKTGADPATMLAFADMESSFEPGISAKTSSATGLYQFISGTWRAMVTKYGAKYNVGYDQIHDPVGNALMGGQFMCDNAAILKSKGISNPTPGQLYIVHFAGSGGGPAMILAAQKTPDADATSLFPKAASANSSIFGGKSISQVVAILSAKADARAKAYAGQYGLPAPCDRGLGGPAVALNPDGSAAAMLNAPGGINMHTRPSGSYVSGGTGVGAGTSPNLYVPTGGSGILAQPVTLLSSTKPNASGYYGQTTESNALLYAAGLPNASQWRKGSTDPTTWSVNQPIAMFNDDGTGSTHSAIFLGLIQVGNPQYTGAPSMLIYDQAPGQPGKQRIVQLGGVNTARFAAINVGNAVPQPGRVQAACLQNYSANTGNCSGFVKAVGATLGITISGTADQIVSAIQSGSSGWQLIQGGGPQALQAAQAGMMVVAGMIGRQQSHPDAHGHVVVVVPGPLSRNTYPPSYWGSLGWRPGAYEPVCNSWPSADWSRLTWGAHPL